MSLEYKLLESEELINSTVEEVDLEQWSPNLMVVNLDLLATYYEQSLCSDFGLAALHAVLFSTTNCLDM